MEKYPSLRWRLLPDSPAALHCLSKELGLSQKDAQALLERAPAVLVTHLKPREAQRLVQVLAGYGISSKIVVGEEVSSPIYIPPVRTQREPLSFWMTLTNHFPCFRT